jgi:type IV secretory pathway VirB2 component (pilin)
MSLTFARLATFTSALAFLLAVAFTFWPEFYFGLWQVQYSSPMGVPTRRTAALLFTLGAILFLARNSEPSSARRALSLGLALGAAALAIQALYEFLTGNAGTLILVACITEVGLAAAFLLVGQRETDAQQSVPADVPASRGRG